MFSWLCSNLARIVVSPLAFVVALQAFAFVHAQSLIFLVEGEQLSNLNSEGAADGMSYLPRVSHGYPAFYIAALLWLTLFWLPPNSFQ